MGIKRNCERKLITLYFPKLTVDKIDKLRKEANQSRTEFFYEVLIKQGIESNPA